MTIQENAKFTCERLVREFSYEDLRDKTTEMPYWDILAIIKHSLEINAINEWEAERYCYQMHCTYDEMLTA